ncbi:hypothetical protein COCCU_11050 [Corynebacterium occultum]|uniref:Uncharacterized protein n=1 Tax=Corynebacterium occultum TaxID=2675219 RepID=A0A6B8W5S5_9CORY|nr:hypothetical protein [Corynebacterium occultum]QGU07317.1 hypothetical protein COCCU_06910 [Corynebacterium occultum]QGU08124.1 hypothetical protein COCCU_11050 [Corynebacterium occultum]
MHTTPHPYYRPTDPAAHWTTHRNRQDLTFWTSVTPDDDADIDTTTSHLAARTSLSTTTTLTWLSIVQLLRHYPVLAAPNHNLGLLDYPRLRAIEHALDRRGRPRHHHRDR